MKKCILLTTVVILILFFSGLEAQDNLSAREIVDKAFKVTKLAGSESLWERRIAIIATSHFIGRDDFDDALAICERLLKDEEDLIHKATGWILREIGKRDLEAEKAFLDRYCSMMPRTMLRYAIERLPPADRAVYLKGVKPLWKPQRH